MITWLTAFIDTPEFEASAQFWCHVSQSTLSQRRGDAAEFATLIPATGDAYLRIQQVSRPPRIHLDLHVEQPHEVARSPRGWVPALSLTAAMWC
jgi:hypothetical protein